MVRHSHQDAIDEQTYEQLLNAAAELDDPYDAECTFIVVAGGRLGMRAGEISHAKASWLNRNRKLLEVPAHEPCECGYCRKRAWERVEHGDVDFEEAMAERWEPKTEHAIRAIPYDFDDHVEAVVEAFFDRFDGYPRSRVSVNRRVDRLAEAAGLPEDSIYPHALRATAASYHAYRGLPGAALRSLMGWSTLATAQKYVRFSGGATADALHDVHRDDE